MRWSQLPVELADRIFATLGLLDLSRIVAVSRFCHERLPTAIAACTKRLKLGGYANAVGLRSTNTLLAHLDAALPRLPRAIVVTWLADFDWRVRPLHRRSAVRAQGGSAQRGVGGGVGWLGPKGRGGVPGLLSTPALKPNPKPHPHPRLHHNLLRLLLRLSRCGWPACAR